MSPSEQRVRADSSPDGGAPSSPRPVPWGGVLARVRASVSARRVVPTGVALVGTDLLYRSALRLSTRRMATATALMETIVGGTPAEADLPRLARSHVAAQARGWELTWRPWELERIPIQCASRIDRARATGRGLVISHAHLGPLAGWVPLGRLLRPLYHPAGDWVVHPPRPGYNGYQLEQRRKLYRDAGIELIYATGSALALYKALSRGGAALLTMDAPGGRRTQFLGKPVDMDDGTARIAMKTGAVILPAALMPVGRRWEIQIGEELDPREFSSPDELHLTLAAVHEDFVMRAPDHLENPKRLWAKATRDGWYQG
jgi:lauroyl/myristoyl acyltransferase